MTRNQSPTRPKNRHLMNPNKKINVNILGTNSYPEYSPMVLKLFKCAYLSEPPP